MRGKKGMALRAFAVLGITLFGAVTAFAQLSGQLSGVIEAGTYTVEGEISVEAGDSLIIEAGTVFNFQGHYKFIIEGWLFAEGTETDSITFTAADTSEGWHGIRFLDAPDSSRLSYCVLHYGRATGNYPDPDVNGGAIYCDNSSPTITGCTISDNTADNYGGGIYCRDSSSPTITDCTISGNTAVEGGGIYCYSSDPAISYCTISGNTADNGGGIYCHGSSPSISDCTISGNTAPYGGGVYCFYNSNVTIENCTISNNTGSGIFCGYPSSTFANCTISNNTGSGIYCFESSPTIANCTISGNTANWSGGGINCYFYSSPTIENCTISDNMADMYGGGIYCYENSSPTGLNNIIWANSAPTGSQISIESGSFSCTYSDIQDTLWPGTGNINADPLFYSTTGDSAYYLIEGSPCIDAGDPTSPLDPDSTIADMGAYYFDQSLGVEEQPGLQPNLFSLSSYPNPFNPSTALSYQLQASSHVNLTIYDIQGREVASLVNGHSSLGYHEVVWNAEGLASGLYFAKLVVDGRLEVRKMVLVK